MSRLKWTRYMGSIKGKDKFNERMRPGWMVGEKEDGD